MKHAINQLQISLETLTTNAPINRERGNIDQAVLEEESAADIREAITALETHDIGYAVRALKQGKRVARQGWNGKDMFLFLLPASDSIPTTAIHDPALREVIESEVQGDTFQALASVRMFTADKKVLTGWLASQSDLMAEDWVVLD